MGQFDFLKSLNIVDESKTAKTRTEKPNGLKLRIYKNGRVVPSQELIDRFKLEYGVEGECGMDIFSSEDWKAYPADQKQVVLCAFIPRGQKNISVFKSRKGEETSIKDQNIKAPELWNLVSKIYGIQEAVFVDLVVNTDLGFNTANGIYNIPKRVLKGEKKGEPTYVRRENITLYPLIPVVLNEENTTEVTQTDSLETLNSVTI